MLYVIIITKLQIKHRKKLVKTLRLFESPPLPTKASKINMSKKNDTSSNNVMMEKIEKIEEKLENYESSNKDMKVALASNMEAIDGLNTKLDKICHLLGVSTENGGKMNESYHVRYSDFFQQMFLRMLFKMELWFSKKATEIDRSPTLILNSSYV